MKLNEVGRHRLIVCLVFIFVIVLISPHAFAVCSDEPGEKETGTLSHSEPKSASSQLFTVSPTVDFSYTKPKFFSFLTSIPKDVANVYKTSFTKENVPMITVIFA